MASKFWIGGTGTWDNTGDTHWSLQSGGANNTTHPTSSDSVTFDGSSGGGTVTVNATITVQSITCGAFTGTLDFSANNNNVNLSANTGFNGSGTGTRTINLGNGTWTISSNGAASNAWTMATTTGLTFNANSSILDFTGASAANKNFSGGGLTYATVKFEAQTGVGSWAIAGANTFSVLTVIGQNCVSFSGNNTATTLNLTGTSTGQVGLVSSTFGTARTLTVTTLTSAWAAFHDITFSGSGLASTNSFDLGGNSGVTITAPPSAGGGSVFGAVGGVVA